MIDRQAALGMAFPEDKPKPYRIFVAQSAAQAVAMVIDLIKEGYPQNEQ